ncbi:MAG: hypothetical protein KDA92_19400 [Planctomycetales bacterium]|nr:hypothetical protein [Planctomycetales bacterium]
MSLFENDEYQWRETFFVLFRDENQPTTQQVEKALRQLDSRFVLRDVRSDEQGRFESLTLESPDDYSAMDISLVRGDEVIEQTAEIRPELLKSAVGNEEKALIKSLSEYHCRYDIYHFEQLVFIGRADEDEEMDDFMDPGAVLTVMQKIAQLCRGVAVDPQANTLIN